ncbi:MAG: hypothetical protein EOO75_10380, partial [Myxococcales bacterium]
MKAETMFFDGANLALAARVALTLTVASFVVMTVRALRRAPDPRARWRVAGVLAAQLGVAALFAHSPLADLLPRLFRVGAAAAGARAASGRR